MTATSEIEERIKQERELARAALEGAMHTWAAFNAHPDPEIREMVVTAIRKAFKGEGK